MKKRKAYLDPEIEFYPILSEKDILTASDGPITGGNETPLIFF